MIIEWTGSYNKTEENGKNKVTSQPKNTKTLINKAKFSQRAAVGPFGRLWVGRSSMGGQVCL